jgi:hypothetical protein
VSLQPTSSLRHTVYQVVHGHVLLTQQWVAVGAVFTGLALEVIESEREKRASKHGGHHHHHHHGSSGAPAAAGGGGGSGASVDVTPDLKLPKESPPVPGEVAGIGRSGSEGGFAAVSMRL